MALRKQGDAHRSAYERTVSEVFSDAPDGVFVPAGAHRAVRELLTASFIARSWILVPALVVLLLSLTAALTVRGELGAAGAQAAISMLFGVCAVWGVRYRTEQSNDRDVYFAQYAHARGLSWHTNNRPEGRVPLMRCGDEQVFEHRVHGQIGGLEATLGNFTYVDVTEKGMGQRDEVRTRFLVYHVRLPLAVARRYRGVHLRPRGARDGAGTFAGTRAVNFESIAFNTRFDVLMTLTQDDIALYELFSPTFIDTLTRGPRLAWQQSGADLVFYRPGHCDVTMQLDRFVLDAQFVIKRYLEEWQ